MNIFQIKQLYLVVYQDILLHSDFKNVHKTGLSLPMTVQFSFRKMVKSNLEDLKSEE